MRLEHNPSCPAHCPRCGTPLWERCATCDWSAAFGPEPHAAQAFVAALMEAPTQTEALAVLGAAALSGHGVLSLIDMLDFARVVPSPVLDRIRQEFVSAADPRHRL
ncbi:hypothetical protein EON82_21860 [bacterium]|nr:MAG: hypothetical protein EON82_21860 [bacterium]